MSIDAPSKTRSGAQGRRERNKRDKLNRIVGAARALFHSQGYEQTTTQQIAKAAGIASGTLFLYVKSKEDLLVLVFNNEMQALVTSVDLQRITKQPVIDQVMHVFQTFMNYHAEDIEIARALIRELTFLKNPERRAEVDETYRVIQGKLNEVLTAAVQRGELKKRADVRLLGIAAFSFYYQQLQLWLSGVVSRTQFERRLYELLALLITPHLKAASAKQRTT